MIEKRHRPLTIDECSLLKRLASRRQGLGNDIAGAGCFTMLILAAGLWMLRLLDLPETPWQAAVTLSAVATGITMAIQMRRRLGKLTTRPGTYNTDLQNGVALETTYHVAEAIQVEELEDEGSNYYLKLVNGEILFLSGQYLYEPELARRFPSTRIRRTVAPSSELLLEFKCLGDYLPPSSTRPPFTIEQHRAGQVPDDGELVVADFESLRRGAA